MIQSIIVYSVLTIVMMYMSYLARAKGKWKYMVYASFAYAAVFGARYGVGTDYMTYLENFRSYSTTVSHLGFSDKFEIGFNLITTLFAWLGWHVTIYFGVIAFIQILFTFLPFRSENKLLPYLVFTFMVGCSWLTYSNGLRQILAVALWIWAVRFMVEKKVWMHYFVILLAVTMHTSALMLVVFYPLYYWKEEWFRNIKWQLLALVLSLVIMNLHIAQNLMRSIDLVAQAVGYGDYADEDSDTIAQLVDRELSLGMGFFITLLLNILLVIFSPKVKNYVKSKYFNAAYNFFVIGIVLKYIFASSMVFSRINYYFINFTFIVAAYTLFYAHRCNRVLFYTLLALYVLTFAATLWKGEENTALFVFFWQKDLYYLK